MANHVLFPQILYKLRNTPLSPSACLSLQQSIRSLYKHKCRFPKTAPNAIFHASIFYNLNDLWTEQLAEIATSLLNQFNTSSPLLFQVSVIRLFRLQHLELAPTSPLVNWILLHDLRHYRYNNIAANLFLINHSDLCLSFRCDSFLTNTVVGGAKPLETFYPYPF